RPEARRSVEQLQLAAWPGQHGEKTVPRLEHARCDAVERVCEEAVLAGRADRDADRLGRSEAVHGPDDRALAAQPLLERPRVLAQLDEDEVGDCALDRVQAV